MMHADVCVAAAEQGVRGEGATHISNCSQEWLSLRLELMRPMTAYKYVVYVVKHML